MFIEVLTCPFSPFGQKVWQIKPFGKSNKKWRIIWLINSTLSESYNWKSIGAEEWKLKMASPRLTVVRIKLRTHTLNKLFFFPCWLIVLLGVKLRIPLINETEFPLLSTNLLKFDFFRLYDSLNHNVKKALFTWQYSN